MNLMPKWMRLLPFSDQLDPIYHILLAVAFIGVMATLMGMLAGLVLLLPVLLLIFLLWCSYIDDGYKEGNDG